MKDTNLVKPVNASNINSLHKYFNKDLRSII